jgi:hypothetical protein
MEWNGMESFNAITFSMNSTPQKMIDSESQSTPLIDRIVSISEKICQKSGLSQNLPPDG